jgi:hypothetical protein
MLTQIKNIAHAGNNYAHAGKKKMLTHEDTLTLVKTICSRRKINRSPGEKKFRSHGATAKCSRMKIRSRGQQHIVHTGKSILLTQGQAIRSRGKTKIRCRTVCCSGTPARARFMRKSINRARAGPLSLGEPRSSASAEHGVRHDVMPLRRGNSEMLTHKDTLTLEKAYRSHGQQLCSRGEKENAHA